MGPGVRSGKTSSLSPVRPPSPRVTLALASRGATACEPRATTTPHSGCLAQDAPNPQEPTDPALSPESGRSKACDSRFCIHAIQVDRSVSIIKWRSTIVEPSNPFGPFTATKTNLNQSIYPSHPSSSTRHRQLNHRPPRRRHHQSDQTISQLPVTRAAAASSPHLGFSDRPLTVSPETGPTSHDTPMPVVESRQLSLAIPDWIALSFCDIIIILDYAVTLTGTTLIACCPFRARSWLSVSLRPSGFSSAVCV